MTDPYFLRSFADVLGAVAEGWTRSDESLILPSDANDRIDAVAVSLANKMSCPVTWSDITTNLRARADTLTEPGLPEGWVWEDTLSDNFRAYARYPGRKQWCAVDLFCNLCVGGSVPFTVVRAVFARAGVTS